MIGWKLVPVEADEDMVDAYFGANFGPKPEYEVMVGIAPSPPDEVLERIARAYDESIGISWARVDYDREAHAGFVADRIKSIRAALAAADGEQASIPAKAVGDNRT